MHDSSVLTAMVGVILGLFLLAGVVVAMLRSRPPRVITAALAGIAGLLIVLPPVLIVLT